MNEHLIYLEQALSKMFAGVCLLIALLLGVILISMLLTPDNIKKQREAFRNSLKNSMDKIFPYVIAGTALGIFVIMLGTQS